MSLNTILATAPLTATGYHLKATGTALGQSLIWDNGTNVGIGNQGTTYTLDVTGSGRYNNASAMALTVNGGTFTQATASSYSLGIGNLGGSDLTLGTSTTAGVIQTWSSKPLVLNPQGNSVGIGTSAPSYLFDITKESDSNTSLAYIKNTAAGRPAYLSFKSPAFNFVTGIKNDVGYVIANNDGTISSNSQINFCINSSGNVGIGIDAPTDTVSSGRVLDIGSSTGASVILRDTTNPTTQYGGISYNGDSDNGLRIWSNGFIGFNLSSSRLVTIANNGNVLIGTTTDSSYKLAVFNGMQYLGTGFVINNDFASTGRQAATGVSDFGGTTVTFDLAAIFPRVTFLNRGLSVTMQLVALPTYTIVSSAFVVLGRTGNSNQWTNTILANLNIAGAAINSVTATGTVITINYSTYIFGTAYINLATIG
jgi:hypothetical protein